MKCKLIYCYCKKKDKNFTSPLLIYVILMDPLLTYFGQSLFYFVHLICRNFSYSEVVDNKICKKDYIYFGVICLLLLIIDFYKIFILICFKKISYISYVMLVNSYILLLLFPILISIFLFKMRIYKHHKLAIYPYILFEIYIIFAVIFTGEIVEIFLLLVQIGISFIESINIILYFGI